MEQPPEDLEEIVDEMVEFYDQLAFDAMRRIINQTNGESE